mmetsp:Transcript_14620/g.39129  ORF Transcript_14620/g.39129 Transcript_14620/m.39129 type:complete len:267 (+) Transcript_14620:101-901(+)|eukprot:CAMPEP_0185829176 /NCGR_PEP_ID=MMETSP1353-20130828/90_1 /TAXON_ID=1077150 /ORGANISM="Erythrolobus australicus, Strain CCMP3124" /LENGTH=266 /DNA_ID=CAMNT_0028526937 /DNA_START=78 /DNA_END=878 /DNA_ORIENTATION=+
MENVFAVREEDELFCHACDGRMKGSQVVERPESGELECVWCHSTCVEVVREGTMGALPMDDFEIATPSLTPIETQPRDNTHGDQDEAGSFPVMFVLVQHNGSPMILVSSGEGPQLMGGPGGVFGNYAFGSDTEFARLVDHLMRTDPNNYGAPRASEKAIAELSRQTWDVSTCGSTCAVCFDDWEAGSRVVRMPCGHVFCEACLVPWLELHNTCPTCRHELLNPADENVSDKASDVGHAPSPPREAAQGEAQEHRPRDAPWWQFWAQ